MTGRAGGVRGQGAEDVYKTVNVVMRRKPKENNFKAILECIRDLMNEQCVPASLDTSASRTLLVGSDGLLGSALPRCQRVRRRGRGVLTLFGQGLVPESRALVAYDTCAGSLGS